VLLELTRLISEQVPARIVLKEIFAMTQAVWQNPNVYRVLPCNFRALVQISVKTAPRTQKLGPMVPHAHAMMDTLDMEQMLCVSPAPLDSSKIMVELTVVCSV